ncbi:GNAT family N-acetyltransferase [Flavobacterium sp. K5-23]|uniref:GNAT family N-acetyltransferase n=1 Tax=Flavobacterium sp. K5-23 TaxID=2746225 RepID=UPI002010A360|nr:GNAT family N-acetyltransferase [Flavobacterium sp. K5-23]UQD56855.1 GNAT family N-acetyltransferase [Flavobacterium sp. K5-23]
MIRSYNDSDKDTLIEIFNLNTPQYFDKKEVADFIEYLDNYSDTYLTIEHEDKIVGGTGYYVNYSDNSGRITWIFFHPNYSGFGLGKQAVEHCLTKLKNNPKVEKLVVTTSQLAYNFFEKFGYKLSKIEKDFWGLGLDLYEMEMPNDQLAINKER